MDDRMDEFETRLRSLQPRAPSPGLRANVAAHLGEASAGAKRRNRGWIIVGGLLAAGLAICIAVRWLSGAGAERHLPPPAKVVSNPSSQPVPADDRPVLSVYTAALMRSPDELDALLERHARSVFPPERKSARHGNDDCISRFSL